MSFKKITLKRLMIIFMIIIFLFFLTAAISAEEYRVIFNQLDAVGDDYGPGYYNYPKNHIFQNKGNLFDLKSLTIFESENDYKFRFSFAKLTDPWSGKFGFSLPLIEVYLDNQAGGSNQVFHSGANISFKKDFLWNRFIKISGWWARTFRPDSKKTNLLDINEFENAAVNKLENLKLYSQGDNIYLHILKKDLKINNNSKLIVMVGSFDPFGYDHHRAVTIGESYWEISSTAKVNLEKSTRVLDLLLAGSLKQKEILRGDLPEIPYLDLKVKYQPNEKSLVEKVSFVNKFHIYQIYIIVFYILIIILIIFKSNNETKNLV